MRWKYFVLPLCLATFACASSTKPEGEHAAKSAAGAEKAKSAGGEEVASNDPKNDDAPVCTMEQVIGSNMRKRVCRSKEQIERERREAQDAARRAQQGAGGSTQNSGGR